MHVKTCSLDKSHSHLSLCLTNYAYAKLMILNAVRNCGMKGLICSGTSKDLLLAFMFHVEPLTSIELLQSTKVEKRCSG